MRYHKLLMNLHQFLIYFSNLLNNMFIFKNYIINLSICFVSNLFWTIKNIVSFTKKENVELHFSYILFLFIVFWIIENGWSWISKSTYYNYYGHEYRNYLKPEIWQRISIYTRRKIKNCPNCKYLEINANNWNSYNIKSWIKFEN